jgi:hypothetical protein
MLYRGGTTQRCSTRACSYEVIELMRRMMTDVYGQGEGLGLSG